GVELTIGAGRIDEGQAVVGHAEAFGIVANRFTEGELADATQLRADRVRNEYVVAPDRQIAVVVHKAATGVGLDLAGVELREQLDIVGDIVREFRKHLRTSAFDHDALSAHFGRFVPVAPDVIDAADEVAVVIVERRAIRAEGDALERTADDDAARITLG